MACEGYEHGTKVILQRSQRHVPAGAIGVVLRIDSVEHKLDVRFERIGVLAGLDAHQFVRESDAEREQDDERVEEGYYENESEG